MARILIIPALTEVRAAAVRDWTIVALAAATIGFVALSPTGSLVRTAAEHSRDRQAARAHWAVGGSHGAGLHAQAALGPGALRPAVASAGLPGLPAFWYMEQGD